MQKHEFTKDIKEKKENIRNTYYGSPKRLVFSKLQAYKKKIFRPVSPGDTENEKSRKPGEFRAKKMPPAKKSRKHQTRKAAKIV